MQIFWEYSNNMKSYKLPHLVALVIIVYLMHAVAPVHSVECESGWIIYKDETCIKTFNELLSYNDARLFCASKSSSLSSASLVTVKEPEMQELLVNYTQGIYEHIWLGAKYDIGSAQFRWDDGDLVTYANWAAGYPRNDCDPDNCIQLKPINAKTDKNLEGSWEDAVCQRRNLVMCQRAVTWTMEDAIREIVKLRRQLQEQISSSAGERNDLRHQLESANYKIEELSTRVVPVGSTYVEYFNQPSPVLLWPSLEWEDVTNLYAGSFFRALGGNSGSWGTTQNECAPRLSHVQYYHEYGTGNEGDSVIDVPKSGGWSKPVFAGAFWIAPGEPYEERMRFNEETCEVRPINQAIRIWKRLA